MTLPSASTLTDEQLRVLAAEARGWKWLYHSETLLRTKNFTLQLKWVLDPSGQLKLPSDAPDPLHDANAALELLDTTSLNIEIYFDQTSDLWTVRLNQRFVGSKSFKAQEPDFCRAIVLAFLRAEGKIL